MGRMLEGGGMPKDAAVEEFAGLVRALKARNGRSDEALGRRLSVSASTLHRYCSGATVPEEFAMVDRLALLCGADEEERRGRLRARAGGALLIAGLGLYRAGRPGRLRPGRRCGRRPVPVAR